jgi:fibronectin-binding autotransporter adhesin
MTTRCMKNVLAAAAFAIAARDHFAFSEVNYVWVSTASPKSWDLTTVEWGNNSNNTLPLLAWPSGDNSSNEAWFYPEVTVNGVNRTIPPGTVFVNGNITVNTIVVAGTGYTFALNSGSMTLVGSNPSIDCSYDTTFSLPLLGTTGASFASGYATITLTAASTYTGNTSITSGTTSLGINNALPNTNIAVAGTLALNTFNDSFANLTVTGALTSTGGILTAASLLNNGTITTAPSTPGAIDGDMTIGNLDGSGNITLNGTFLTAGVNAGQIDTYTGNLSGNGSLFKTGSSELILQGYSSLTGGRSAPDISVEAGTLAGNTNNLVGSVYVVSGATLLFAQSANGTFSGSFTGNGTVRASGLSAGTVLTFTTANPFTGSLVLGTTIILAISADNQLGAVVTTQNNQRVTTYSAVAFDGGTLRPTTSLSSLRPYTITQNGGTLDTNALSPTFTGTFTSTGNGTFNIIGGGSASFSNTLSFNALAINQATVAFTNSNFSTIPLTLASTSSALALTDSNLTITYYSATAAGPVSLLGNSTLTLSRTKFQSGSVSIANASGANDAVDLTGISSSWTINGDLTLGKDAVVIKPLSSAAGVGTLSVPTLESVSVSGTTTLLANSTISVAGSFSTGALANSASSTPILSVSDFVSFPVSPAFTLGGDTAANTTYSGIITNGASSGSIHKVGANTQTLSGNNSYTGVTLIDGGSLIIDSNTALPAASLITNNANLTIAASAVSANILSGTGTLTINSSDRLTLAGGGASKQSGLSFNSLSLLDLGANPFILEATSANKAFLLNQAILDVESVHFTNSGIISSTVSANPAKYAIAVVDNSTLPTPYITFGGQPVDPTSILIAPALLGDTDLSGTVNATDLNTVLSHLGQTTAAWTSGNFDGNPTIDLTDLNDVLNNLGQTFANPAQLTTIPTPEPATLAILGILAPAFLKRRRG